MPGLIVFPPWPENVPAHPLLVVDYQRIKAGDEDEIDTLWKAATELGFWYLKNHGAEEEVDGMFDMGADVMGLPLAEKMLYEQGDDGVSHGYKAAGKSATDETGALDSVEFFNVSRADALAWPAQVDRAYPPVVVARMPGTVVPFVRKAAEVNRTLISVLGDRLGLPEDALLRRHPVEEHSGCEARCIRSPPRPEGMTEDRAALGAHTDFGSLSFLHNRMGGLQVLVPGSSEWQWAKPIPGHAICNLGDAMTILSGGILRSNLHRIVPPPKEQGRAVRWSVVFFTRPGDSTVLRPLVEESPLIAAAVKLAHAGKFETGVTAKDWFARRTKYERVKNRTGPETWHEGRGMEHEPSAR